MILQALCSYYDRLTSNDNSDVPLPGFSTAKVHAALVINKQGQLVQFRDLRQPKGKKVAPMEMNLPQAVKRTVGVAPNFMWDNTGYVLGADNKEDSDRAQKTFQAFKKFHHELGDSLSDEGMKALLKFLDTWEPSNAPGLEHWDELAGGNVVFQLEGERQFIHQHSEIKNAWMNNEADSEKGKKGICLISGINADIARLHPAVKGVRDAQSSGAALVSFNKDSFCSYDKEQNYNAPMSEQAAFAYTTALNYLLRSGSPQKIQIGDATTVFWTERNSPIEGFMGMILDPRDDAADNQELRNFLQAIRDGKQPKDVDPEVKFYILGLSPNASRLSVRFWHVSSVGDVDEKLHQHFADLQIIHQYDSDPDYPGLWQILKETARETKDISPLLSGAFVRSILTGLNYPEGLLLALINRIRADQTINYLRAAMIKAILNRQSRIFKQGMEVSMSLNKEDTRQAYLCGRLFAVLEKVQTDALGKDINSTIRDRFFGAASATPRIVFPQLLRLAQHHIDKSDYGFAVDKQIEEILSHLQEFPAHLTLEDQGLFTIGYYHQRQNFFVKKENN